MKVNRTNYEAYFLDYHEGNLDEQSKKEVLAFLKLNPGLQAEFESFEPVALAASSSIKFPGRESLKKVPIHERNYKTWLVAYCENDLDETGRREVEYVLDKNASYRNELQ